VGGEGLLGHYLHISLGLGVRPGPEWTRSAALPISDSRFCLAQSWRVCFTLGLSKRTPHSDHSPAQAPRA